MSNFIGKYVILRSISAGVFFGILKEINGNTATMSSVRKIHYQVGAAAVEQLAEDGIKNIKESRLTVVVSEMEIMSPVQIIPCTEKSIENLTGIPIWKV